MASNSELEFVKSQMGKDQLLHNGYLYVKERETSEKSIWRCTRYTSSICCRARVHVINSTVTEVIPHTHLPNAMRVWSIKLKNEAKEKAESSKKKPRAIASEVLKDVPEKFAPGLPSTSNLAKIGADGAKSLVRRNMNVNTFEMPYNQFGVVATLELESTADGNSTAWQRFLPTGPVALLPLSATHSSLVWSTMTEESKKLLKMSPEDFVKELNEAFVKNYRSDDILTSTLHTMKNCILPQGSEKRRNPPRVKSVVENSRAAFPLGLSHASSYARTGVCLIGDAAHRVHPLAGQGVNLGFGDVKCLVNVLEDHTLNGAMLGDLGYLLKYERERLTRNVPIMLGIHGIQRLYNTDFAPVVALRTLGLQVTQSIPILKKVFMDRAMY